MCDYSLHTVTSRPAKVGDKLVSTEFRNSVTRGFSAVGDPTVAAIASELAGTIYGLVALKENIEDEEHNTTRFLVMARDPKWTKVGNGLTVTTFVFDVRNVPAALYKALGGFATNGINMTKLESYMVGGRFTATQFYADVEGHPEDRPLRLALEELAFFSLEKNDSSFNASCTGTSAGCPSMSA